MSTTKPTVIKNGKIVPMTEGAKREPNLVFDGKKPANGEVLEFDPGNGVTYTGKVLEAVEADGNVVVSFEDGISPKKAQPE